MIPTWVFFVEEISLVILKKFGTVGYHYDGDVYTVYVARHSIPFVTLVAIVMWCCPIWEIIDRWQKSQDMNIIKGCFYCLKSFKKFENNEVKHDERRKY